MSGTNASGGAAKNIKLETGNKATPYIPNPADIARVLPYSLDKQLVPGEYWSDMEGNVKQVYQRSFRGAIQDIMTPFFVAEAERISLQVSIRIKPKPPSPARDRINRIKKETER